MTYLAFNNIKRIIKTTFYFLITIHVFNRQSIAVIKANKIAGKKEWAYLDWIMQERVQEVQDDEI